MSDINYIDINEDFPYAGEDNDTQVFRDNFNIIKHSLEIAGNEITDLQVQKATLIDTNDFGQNTIENAAFKNIREHFIEVTVSDNVPEIIINYADGAYQIVSVKSNNGDNDRYFEFTGFPDGTDIGKQFVGKMTLELYNDDDDSTAKIITIPVPEGTTPGVIKKNRSFGSDSSEFWTTNEDNSVSFVLSSLTDPVIIEVWRRDNTLFLNYLGEFY